MPSAGHTMLSLLGLTSDLEFISRSSTEEVRNEKTCDGILGDLSLHSFRKIGNCQWGPHSIF